MQSSSALHSSALRDDLRPFREPQVGGYENHGRLLGALRYHLEQELRTNLGQRHVAQSQAGGSLLLNNL